MFKFRFALKAVMMLVGSLVFTSIAQAQMTQTFVSAQTGNDANDCSLANPCRSFNRALQQVQAKGEVTALDSGEYAPFTVTKAVAIQAAPGVYAGITATAGNAVAIGTGPIDVVLRGLTLNGLGASVGIFTPAQGTTLHVENCVINGFSNRGIFFQGGQLFVNDTTVRNSGSGIFLSSLSGTITATLDRCRLQKNAINGLEAAIASDDRSKVTVRDTVSMGNGGAGFRALMGLSGEPLELNLENCVATNNGWGIISERVGAIVRVSNSTITNNSIIGVFVSAGGIILTRSNNTVEGNTTNGNFTGTFTVK